MSADWHPLLELTVLVFAVARVTMLVTQDTILDFPRGRLLAALNADHGWRWYVSTLIECPLCAGFWIAVLWSGAWALWPVGTTVAAVPWALAMAAFWVGGFWRD